MGKFRAPNGQVVEATDAEAPLLLRLGYAPETGVQAEQRKGEDARRDYYTEPLQKVGAVVEGGLSGLTLGLSDVLAGDEESAGRAKYNPGLRGAGEFLGALLPSVVNPESLAGRVLRASPSGLVAQGGEAIGRVAGGGLKGAVAQGVFEGSVQGLGGAVGQSALTGDPLTADAVLESVGMGAAIGGGVSGLAEIARSAAGKIKAARAGVADKPAVSAWDQAARDSLERKAKDLDVALATAPDRAVLPADREMETQLAGIEDQLTSLQTTLPDVGGATKRLEQIGATLAQREADRAAAVAPRVEGAPPVRNDFTPPVDSDSFQALRDSAKRSIETGRAHLERPFSAVDELDDALAGEAGRGKPRIISSDEYRRAARASGDDLLGQVAMLDPARQKALRDPIRRLRRAWGALDAAPAVMENAAEHAAAVADLAKRTGFDYVPLPRHPSALRVDTASAARTTFAGAAIADARLAMAESALSSMPKTVAGFARMAEGDRAHLLANLERVATHEWAEPLRNALPAFREAVGVTETSLGEGVNRLYRDHADVMSGRVEKMLKAERATVERQIKAATTGSARDVESARKALLARKHELLAARKSAESAADEAHRNTLKLLKEERRAVMGDLRNLPDPAAPRAVKKNADSLRGRFVKGAGALALGGPKAMIAEVTGLRKALTDRVANAIANHGERAAGVLRRLGPPSARLHQRLLGGDDPHPNDREAAAARTEEILRLGPVVRDASYAAASPLAADSGPEFAMAIAARMNSAVDHLLQYLPRDPGTARHLLRSDWKPSAAQAEELAARLEAFHAPHDALDRLLAGDVDPAAAETLWAVWPGLMTEARDELIAQLPFMGEEMPLENVSGFSTAFRVPLDDLLRPENVAHIQSLYQTAMAPTGSGSGPSKPPGRPAAAGNKSPGTLVQSLTQ